MKIITPPLSDPFEIPVKRLYLPFRVLDDCPKCGKQRAHDLNSQYLSYPVLGDTISLGFYCEEGHPIEEWTCEVMLQVSLEPAPESP